MKKEGWADLGLWTDAVKCSPCLGGTHRRMHTCQESTATFHGSPAAQLTPLGSPSPGPEGTYMSECGSSAMCLQEKLSRMERKAKRLDDCSTKPPSLPSSGHSGAKCFELTGQAGAAGPYWPVSFSNPKTRGTGSLTLQLGECRGRSVAGRDAGSQGCPRDRPRPPQTSLSALVNNPRPGMMLPGTQY